MAKLKTRKLTSKKSRSPKKARPNCFLDLFLFLITMLFNIYNFAESSELVEDEEQIEIFFESDIQTGDDKTTVMSVKNHVLRYYKFLRSI